MTGTDAVLAAIDHALDDYDTSVDAMRWTAEPARPSGAPNVYLRPMFVVPTGASVLEAMHRLVQTSPWLTDAMTPMVARAGREFGRVVAGFRPSAVLIDEPFRVRRVESARERRVASAMRQRDRRAARRRRLAGG